MTRSSPQTTLAAALALCGLTPAAAARWLDVEERVLRDWITGRSPVPPAVFRMLGTLYGRMTDAALAASLVATGSGVARDRAIPPPIPPPTIPERASVDDVDDPYPGHGAVLAGAMAVLIALGQDEHERAARSGGGVAGMRGAESRGPDPPTGPDRRGRRR